MKKFIKILSLCLIMTMLLSFTACNVPAEPNEDVNVNDVVIELEKEMSRIMLSSGEAVIDETTNSVSKTITATVLPEDAPDKSVDWSIEWLENNEGEDAIVTDYVTVTPTEDGSLTATVTAYRSFENSTISIIAKTRFGEATASCVVRFVGVPSSLEIVQFDGIEIFDEYYQKNIINLVVGQSYYFDVSLNNVFGNVTENYVPDIEIIGVSFGNLNINRKYYTCTSTDRTWKLKEDVVVEMPLTFENGSWGCSYQSSSYKLFSIDYSDGQLMISSNSVCENINFVASWMYEKYELSFDSIVDAEPYVELTILDRNSNASTTLLIRTVKAIESVSLDNNELVF